MGAGGWNSALRKNQEKNICQVKKISTTCWICQSDASSTDIDHSNRKFYQCTAPDCGDYDISWRSEEIKEADVAFKEYLKLLAK